MFADTADSVWGSGKTFVNIAGIFQEDRMEVMVPGFDKRAHSLRGVLLVHTNINNL